MEMGFLTRAFPGFDDSNVKGLGDSLLWGSVNLCWPLIWEVDMGAAHSKDLRERVVAEVEGGSSRRAAARRFKVGESTAIRWVVLKASTGSLAPRQGRKPRSPLEAHEDWLLELIAREPALTLAQIVDRIDSEHGLKTSDSSVDRFFRRHAITFKKNAARGRTGAAGRG